MREGQVMVRLSSAFWKRAKLAAIEADYTSTIAFLDDCELVLRKKATNDVVATSE